MTSTRAAQERRMQEKAGPLARATAWTGTAGTMCFKIRCTQCTVRPTGARWTTHRNGKRRNTYVLALSRWTLHLHYQHPDETAPCLDGLDTAQRVLDEDRAVRQAERDQKDTETLHRWAADTRAAAARVQGLPDCEGCGHPAHLALCCPTMVAAGGVPLLRCDCDEGP